MNHTTIYQATPDKQIGKHIFKTAINGLYYINIDKHNDQRGFFSQIVEIPELEQVLGKKFEVKQINYSNSKTNVVRGMHAEGWNKLVTVTHGAIFSALVDIRPNSSSFKVVEYFKLGFNLAENTAPALFISQGIANSLCALQGPVNYIYLVDKLYQDRNPAGDVSLDIFDPDLNISWPIAKKDMILSKRDKNVVKLSEMVKKLDSR